MSWGGPKIFCDLTDPHWVCLGTHRHPWELSSEFLKKANLFVFLGIEIAGTPTATGYRDMGMLCLLHN